MDTDEGENIVKKILLRNLLNEYYQQLTNGVVSVQAELEQHMETPKIRVWNKGEGTEPGFMGIQIAKSPPTAYDDLNKWHWEDGEKPLHPTLLELNEIIERIGEFVADLDGEGKDEE